MRGYHPGDYSYPRTNGQAFEICCGALLAANVAWPNAEKALVNLKKEKLLTEKAISTVNIKKLEKAVQPSGFYRQKAKRLKDFSQYVYDNYETVARMLSQPTGMLRRELLSLKGIGPETADSMLLYAGKKPVFVVDAYTKRIFANLGLVEESAGYDEVQALFKENLKPDVPMFQEYHALLVEHAKHYYQKKGEYHLCPLYRQFKSAEAGR